MPLTVNKDGILVTDSGKFKIIPGSEWALLKDVIHDEDSPDSPEFDVWVENDVIDLYRQNSCIFVNDAFIELWDKTTGIMFLAGGYGSSKTTYVITRLLVKCIENKQFKCFYGRQKKTEARELHDNIVREIIRNGWEDDFDFSMKDTGTTGITYIPNGNCFKLFGCDDEDSLKGIDNPTDIFIDEINQLTFTAFGRLVSRLRTPGVDLQLVGCFNNCDVYEDHWIYKYIYSGEDSKDANEVRVQKALKKKKIVKHHSIYTDNKFVNPDNYRAALEINAGGDLVKIGQYINGDWGVKLSKQPYYKQFKALTHVSEDIYYDPNLPLHISFDKNKQPYFPCLIAQLNGGDINLIDEIAATNPNNTTDWICAEFARRYENHKSGLYIYGDATSAIGDVTHEKGENMYTIIASNLKQFHPEIRVDNKNPNNKDRGNFINLVFKSNYGGLDVKVHPDCVHMISDFTNCEEAPDGKGKDKKTSMVNGVKGVQRYGHFGDAFDYLICSAHSDVYEKWRAGDITYDTVSGGRTIRNGISAAMKEVVKEIAPKPTLSKRLIIDQYGIREVDEKIKRGKIIKDRFGIREVEDDYEADEIVYVRVSRNRMN